MDLGPLLPGRIPGTLVSDRLRANLQDSQRSLVKLQEQISTGQKYFIPSDNPSAAVRAISLQTLVDRKDQMLTNISTNKTFLSATENSLATVSDALNKARQLATAGIGNSSSPNERQAMAIEAQSLVRQVVNAGNSSFRGRFLFAGTQNSQPPFTMLAENAIRYEGDTGSINSYIDFGLLQANNVSGSDAFGALSPPVGRDVNPALTLQTRVSDLHGGQGVVPGSVVVSLSSPAVTQTIDLSGAKTIGDIKQLVEAAFSPGDVTVSLNAGANGLQFTPGAGNISVTEVAGGFTAANLGILSATPGATVAGSDLNPRLTTTTALAALNGGTGIGPTAGNGLLIKNGTTTRTIDLSGLVTVEDLLNTLRDPALGLSAEINSAGNGLAISTRLSGANFSIGENNGQNATLLGIRTLTASTQLSQLNYGRGVPVNAGFPLEITRRDGTALTVDLADSVTVQDVIDRINAADPGNLVASLNSVGNGISLLDNSGTGPLTVPANSLSTALGLAGSETGTDNTVPLVGQEPNWQEAPGVLNILTRLQTALSAGDNNELSRLADLIARELDRTNQVRGELGSRQKTLEDVENRIEDTQIDTRKALSLETDVDLAEVLSALVNQQTIFEASLRSAATIMQLSLANYL